MQVIDFLQGKGDTPLHLIAQTGSPEDIKHEWEVGHEAGQYPDIDILDRGGKTALQNAALFNANPESIKTLVDLGASLKAGTPNLTPWDLVNMNPNLSREDKAKAREYLRSS